MIKTVLTGLATLAVTGLATFGVATAQSNSLGSSKSAKVENPSQLLTSLHAEAIIPVLTELGLQYQGATLPNGQKVILAKAQNGIKFQLTPMACDKGNNRCRGLNMVAMFDTNAPSRTVSAFNYRYAFISAGKDDTGVAYITRYDIADYGMPKGNLAVALTNYLHMASVFDRHLYEATHTVSKEVSGTDFAANGLNMQSILVDNSLARSVGLSENSHRVSFEAISNVVDTFVRADELAPGRLINQVQGDLD